MGRLVEKTRGKKSRATVPLTTYMKDRETRRK
jgi:hypothetical protein